MNSKLDKTINYYNENGREYYKNTVGVKLDHLYKRFLALIPKEGKILDAGCGSGRDTLYFINEGYTVTSMDASQTMAKLCQELTGQACLNLTFHDMVFKEDFDGIWACATLLHVPRNDINVVILKLTNGVKVNGVIYASFKYGSKEEFRNGRIFSYLMKNQ